MNTITMTRPTGAKPFARIAESAGTVVLHVVDFVRAYLNRRDIHTLAGFDDRMLADIDRLHREMQLDQAAIEQSQLRTRRMLDDLLAQLKVR